MSKKHTVAIAFFLAITCSRVQAAEETQGNQEADLQTFDARIKPLLQTIWVDCHSGKRPTANIALDTIDPDLINGKDFDHWEDIREAFNTGEMPPEDQPQPSAEQRVVGVGVLRKDFLDEGHGFNRERLHSRPSRPTVMKPRHRGRLIT